MNTLQRARLSAQLTPMVAELVAAKSPIQRARLAKSVNDLLAQMGVAGLSNDQVKLLTDIAEGRHDGDGLEKLYDLIDEAVRSLGPTLTSDAEHAAQTAVTRWAQLEEKTNG